MHACGRGERAGARNAAKFKHALHITESLEALLGDTASSSAAAAEARIDGDAASHRFWAKASSCSFSSNSIDILSMRWSTGLLQLAAHLAFITPLRAISSHSFRFVPWYSKSGQKEAPPSEGDPPAISVRPAISLRRGIKLNVLFRSTRTRRSAAGRVLRRQGCVTGDTGPEVFSRFPLDLYPFLYVHKKQFSLF